MVYKCVFCEKKCEVLFRKKDVALIYNGIFTVYNMQYVGRTDKMGNIFCS
jgi:hypothetical protein